MIGIYIGLFLLTFSTVIACGRMFFGPGDANRALAADLVFFSVIGLITVMGLLFGSHQFVDLVIIATVLGLLATVSLARAITRGHR